MTTIGARGCNMVFEGLDRVGKTDLLNAVARRLRHDPSVYEVTTIKMLVPQRLQESYNRYSEHFGQLLSRGSEEVQLWDRGLPSELVYSRLYRYERYGGAAEYEKLVNWLLSKDSLIESRARYSRYRPTVYVHVVAPFEENLSPDERTNVDRAKEADGFEAVFKSLRCPVIEVRTQDERGYWRDKSDLVDEVLAAVAVALTNY